MGASTLDLVEQWRFHTGPASSWPSTPSPLLFIANGKVIISYGVGERYGDEDFASFLTALSLETGAIVWQTRLVNPRYGTNIQSGYLGKERLYLVYSFRVNAFDLDTGELVWSTPDLGGHTGYYFRPWDSDDPLLLHSTNHEVIALNPEDGTILSKQADGEWIQNEQIEFRHTWEGLHAVDQQSGRVLWTRILEAQPPMRQMNLWPSFLDRDILFEEGGVCYKLIRATIETGQVVWETPERNYLSNFALANSRVYALREDTTLAAFDLESGEVVGTLEFDGPPAKTVCAKSGSDVYWVVTDGEYVLVYFGDTQELIALKGKTDSQP